MEEGEEEAQRILSLRVLAHRPPTNIPSAAAKVVACILPLLMFVSA